MRKVLTVAIAGMLSTGLATGASAASGSRPRVPSVAEVARQSVPTPFAAGSQRDVVVQGAVAASPAHPLLAAAVTEEGLQVTPAGTFGVALSLAVTHNGGASWDSRVLPGMTVAADGRWQGVSWPTVAVGSDATIYVAGALRQDNFCHNGLGVLRSTDGGRSFGPLVVVQHEASCASLDARSSLVVDDGTGSPHRGRLYLGWTQFRFNSRGSETGQVQMLRYSDDGGRRWSAAVSLTAARTFTQGTNLILAPRGALTDVYYTFPSNGSRLDIVAQTSRNGGRTFTSPSHVTRWGVATAGGANIRCCQPSAAADPVTGKLYVAVGDPRFRDGRYDDALVFRSTDGRHWSGATRADTVPGSGAEYATPEVAAYNGDVYVSWTLLPNLHGTVVRQQMSLSTDGGTSFGAPTTLGPDGDLRYAALAAGFGYWLGDITGLAAVPGHAYAAWPLPTKTRSVGAQHQTLWAATVSAGGR